MLAHSSPSVVAHMTKRSIEDTAIESIFDVIYSEGRVDENRSIFSDIMIGAFNDLLKTYPPALNAVETQYEDKVFTKRKIQEILHCLRIACDIPEDIVNIFVEIMRGIEVPYYRYDKKKLPYESWMMPNNPDFPPLAYPTYKYYPEDNSIPKSIKKAAKIISYETFLRQICNLEPPYPITRTNPDSKIAVLYLLAGMIFYNFYRGNEYLNPAAGLLIIQLLRNVYTDSFNELMQINIQLRKIMKFFMYKLQRRVDHVIDFSKFMKIRDQVNACFVAKNLEPIPIFSEKNPGKTYSFGSAPYFIIGKIGGGRAEYFYEILIHNFFPNHTSTVAYPDWGDFPLDIVKEAKNFTKKYKQALKLGHPLPKNHFTISVNF